jgi:uncharacterized protein YjiS (DUF1127 family)
MRNETYKNTAPALSATERRVIDTIGVEAAARELRAREFARLIGVLAGKVKSALVGPLARWRRREALANELYSLDERMLKDIGLSRSEIPFIVSGNRVPTPHQDNVPARAA